MNLLDMYFQYREAEYIIHKSDDC